MEDGDGNGSGAVLAGDWRLEMGWKTMGLENMETPSLALE
jgi:hypothetical protein